MKDIVGYEGKYAITVEGKVWSYLKQDWLVSCPNIQVEYLQVSLWKQNQGTSFYVHRLVATHFIPNPDGLAEVNHIDGNRHNNNIANLEWVDRQGNALHAIRTGLKTYTNRLSKDEFINCLYDVINGESYASVSERVPYKVPFLSTKLRKLARELGIEDELNKSLQLQRINRANKNLGVLNTKRATTIRKE